MQQRLRNDTDERSLSDDLKRRRRRRDGARRRYMMEKSGSRCDADGAQDLVEREKYTSRRRRTTRMGSDDCASCDRRVH